MAKTFEQSIAELEEIVEQLENGDVTLDESLGLFEKGIKLSKSCQKMLDTAEKKVSILMTNDDGEIVKEDLQMRTMNNIKELLKEQIKFTDGYLDKYLAEKDNPQNIIYKAMRYSVLRAVKDFVRYL